MLRNVAFFVILDLFLAAVVTPLPAVAQSGSNQNETCSISATTQPWNAPGVMIVKIDNNPVGTFQFGPGGNEGLLFSCSQGAHNFTFIANFSTGETASCSGSFSVDQNLNFVPQMNVGPNGTTCSL